ncbi:MAG TPA: 30S ribosomal protein S6 [Gammaproteobacteria bacterium]|jgi:small subunit ribosomal protein S6|nr:30S ribosomal protein S6 [Gammaproteobacteria bacterium]HIK76747.1 30S ribosomal protein S6 [Gammaproteobacteria bacterium]
MRHYELVLLVHPDQSDQVPEMINRYQDTVKKNNGMIHRSENIGRLQLAYTIENMHKAHYVIMNIECDDKVIKELESSFKFNDSIIRHLLVKTKKAETEPSKLFLIHNKDNKYDKKETVNLKNKEPEEIKSETVAESPTETKESSEEEQNENKSSEHDVDETIKEEKVEEEDEKNKD